MAARYRYGDARHHRPLRVGDDAGDLTGLDLRLCRDRQEREQDCE